MIIFLYGEDQFRSSEKLAEIKNKFLQNTHSGASLSVVDFEESSNVNDLFEALHSGGLFSVKKLVIVKNIFLQGKTDIQKQALEYLEAHPNLDQDQDLVAIFWDKGAPKGKPKFFQYLCEKTKKQNFEKLEGMKLQKWAIDRIKSNGSQISKSALDKLLAYVGNDLFHLNNEISKLCLYAENRMISDADVALFVKSKSSSTIFETIEALSGGRKKDALRLLYSQIEQGEDVFYIFSMYVYQFRNLLKIADFYFSGNRNQYEIAKLTKLHPFVVGKAMAQLRNFSLDQLKKVYSRLEKIDYEAKTGRVDLGLALDRFIVEM